jgi:hypothetical protein
MLVTTVTVTRGCKNAAVTDDDYDNDEETNKYKLANLYI